MRADEPLAALSATGRLLINGQVLNAETTEPIKTFRVIPGVRYNGRRGSRSSIAVWQPHMIREMTDGKFEWPRTRGYDEMRFRIEADGYRPATTTWLGKGGPHLRMKVHLRPEPGISGVVTTPDSEVAAQAVLAIGLPNRGVRLTGCQVKGHGEKPLERLSDQWRRPQSVESDDAGKFLLPFETDQSAMLCVVHPSGYLQMPYADFARRVVGTEEPIQLQLQPWATIEGRVLWKDVPGSGAEISLSAMRGHIYPELITVSQSTRTDQIGNYKFRFVPPGSVQIGHNVASPPGPREANAIFQYPVEVLDLTAGQSKVFNFGGAGIEVTGKLTGLRSYESVSISIQPPAPDAWRDPVGNVRGVNGRQAGYLNLKKSDYASLYFRDNLSVEEDGSFKITDVMTGKYNFWVIGATGAAEFNVRTDSQPQLDIGTIMVKPSPAAIPK